MKTHSSQRLDAAGIGLSVLCLAQCLLLPVVATALPAFAATTLSDHIFHQALVWLVLPVSLLAFALGCARHRRLTVLIPATVGLGLLLSAVWLGHDAGISRALTLFGALGLALGHWMNYRLCRQPEICDGHANPV